MLFDLRGRGRRRAVQGIYLGLALLMGGGLVLFGVGGATSGGLLDAFKSNSGQTSVDKVFQQRVDKAETGIRVHPTDPKAWAEIHNRTHHAGGMTVRAAQSISAL